MGTFYPRCRAILRVLMETFDAGEGNEVETYDVIPRKVTIERNTLREADRFTIELDFKSFPFDPRTMRSVLIAIHLGERLDDNPLKDIGFGRSTRAFIGYVDEPKTTLSNSGEVVTLTGRDYTGIFQDYTWPQFEAVDVTRPLELVLGGVLQAVPGAEELAFEFSDLAQDRRFTILGNIIGRTKFTPKGDRDDAWTVIGDLLAAAGLLPVVELDRLIVKTPGEFGDQQPSFIYGRNIESLSFSRKFNEVRTEQIRVTCWDEQAGELRSATFPERQIVVRKRIAPKSGKATPVTAPIKEFNVSGSYGTDDLLRIAQRIYEDGAREQFEGEIVTKDLTDLEGVFSLPRLGNGDSIIVKLGNDATAGSIQGLTIEEGAQQLTETVDRMDPRVALALARSLRLADRLQAKFYVKTARHMWDRMQGYELTATFINYVGEGHG